MDDQPLKRPSLERESPEAPELTLRAIALYALGIGVLVGAGLSLIHRFVMDTDETTADLILDAIWRGTLVFLCLSAVGLWLRRRW